MGFTYVWDVSTGSQTTQTATGLIPSNYCVTATDGNGCTDTDCEDVSSITGINEIAKEDLIRVQRNSISIKASNGVVEVYSLTGQRVHRSSLNNGKNSISLNQGIYIVRVTSKGKQFNKKVYISGY